MYILSEVYDYSTINGLTIITVMLGNQRPVCIIILLLCIQIAVYLIQMFDAQRPALSLLYTNQTPVY